MDTSAREQVTVSQEVEGFAEWHGLKGGDRTSLDRRERECRVKMVRSGARQMLKGAREAQFSEYTKGSVGGGVLVAVFDCQGCQPSRLVGCGPVAVKTTRSQTLHVETLDIEAGWLDDSCDAEGNLAMITGGEADFRLVR